MSDVFALLEQDHRSVETLFDQFEQSADADVALTICQELTIHALLEEELVYPVLASKVAHHLANEAREEHDQAKLLISQIESGVGRGEDVSALVGQLRQDVQHHVQEEETEVFPRMRESLPTVVESMGEDVVQRKEVLQSQMQEALSSGQPPSSVGNKATNA